MKSLVKYDAMCHAIDVAYKIDEVKDIRDKAIALAMYAKQAKNVEAERRACEIRLRAERKCGQLTAKIEKAKPPGGKKLPDPGTISKADRLHAAGISHQQASRWERLGQIPQDQFEKALANGATEDSLTRKKSNRTVSDEALWLWGRLREFCNNLLPKSANEVMATMTENMRIDVNAQAPKVAAWLKQIGETNGKG